MKKQVLGITLGLTVGLTAQFLQIDGWQAGDIVPTVGMQQAEAGALDKLKKKAMDKAQKKATKEIHKATLKALSVDMNKVNEHMDAMKAHLNLATSFTAAAQYQLMQAAALQGSGNFDEIGNIANNTRTNFNDLSSAYRYAEISGIDASLGSLVEKRLASQDANTKDDAKKWLSYAKESRAMSAWYKNLADRDAGYVVREAEKGIAQKDRYPAEAGTLQQYKSAADDTKAICKNLGNKTGVMDKAVKNAESKCNIKAPTKERQQQIANSIRA